MPQVYHPFGTKFRGTSCQLQPGTTGLQLLEDLCVLNGFVTFPTWVSQDAYRLQLKMFLYEVKQQQLLSGVRTFLKVYSSISLAKLANYMEVDEPTLR